MIFNSDELEWIAYILWRCQSIADIIMSLSVMPCEDEKHFEVVALIEKLKQIDESDYPKVRAAVRKYDRQDLKVSLLEKRHTDAERKTEALAVKYLDEKEKLDSMQLDLTPRLPRAREDRNIFNEPTE
jgi:hypothetical protein